MRALRCEASTTFPGTDRSSRYLDTTCPAFKAPKHLRHRYKETPWYEPGVFQQPVKAHYLTSPAELLRSAWTAGAAVPTLDG
jgi:hypothetical protein